MSETNANPHWCERCEELRFEGTCGCTSGSELRLVELLFPLVF